jgi:hypothetical protein
MTEDQQKVVDDAQDSIAKIYIATREKLSTMGVHFEEPDEGTTRCTVCDCESFIHRRLPPNRPPDMRCARSGCGHFWARHDVF